MCSLELLKSVYLFYPCIKCKRSPFISSYNLLVLNFVTWKTRRDIWRMNGWVIYVVLKTWNHQIYQVNLNNSSIEFKYRKSSFTNSSSETSPRTPFSLLNFIIFVQRRKESASKITNTTDSCANSFKDGLCHHSEKLKDIHLFTYIFSS